MGWIPRDRLHRNRAPRPESARLEHDGELAVERSCVRLCDVLDDGKVLFDAVVEHGLAGVVAKKRNGI